MSIGRMTRVNELIRREVGMALFRIMTEQEFDLSAVTVTEVVTSPTLRSALVLVSIRDHEDERNRMLHLLRRHRVDIQKLIARNITLKYTPRIEFQLDTSIEKGDRILHVLHGLEPAAPESDTPPAPEPVDEEAGNG